MSLFVYRLGWGVAALFALLFIASLAIDAQGGSLDPAGSPGSTMKSLDDLPPAWHQKLLAAGGCASQRFECVLPVVINPTSPPEVDYQGILDHETGLVWERTPGGGPMNWYSALLGCQAVNTGERYGWRLPSVEELRSLADTASATFPAGGAFVLPNNTFWTTTTDPTTKTRSYIISRSNPAPYAVAQKFDASNFRWCVRGISTGTNGAYEEAQEPAAWRSDLSASPLFGIDGCRSLRFTCDVGLGAVLDHETGLIWERAPTVGATAWVSALFGCANLYQGSRFGWHLPTVEELTSLFDLSLDHLPDGHPFQLSGSALASPFWTATADPFVATQAYVVTPSLVSPTSAVGVREKTSNANRWCVRGGQGFQGGQ